MAADIFGALGDPTRRNLYRALATSGPVTATTLASNMDITRQAVAKHLGVLADAGMATSERVGRETRFEAKLDPLSEVSQWIREVEGQWDDRLGALASSLAPKDAPQ